LSIFGVLKFQPVGSAGMARRVSLVEVQAWHVVRAPAGVPSPVRITAAATRPPAATIAAPMIAAGNHAFLVGGGGNGGGGCCHCIPIR
jgi:hypothetical protein